MQCKLFRLALSTAVVLAVIACENTQRGEPAETKPSAQTAARTPADRDTQTGSGAWAGRAESGQSGWAATTPQRQPQPLSGAGRPKSLPPDQLRTPKIFRGTPPPLQQQTEAAEPSAPGAGQATALNFVDADIREVVRVVLGDILKKNYIIDPRVQGTVTMQSSGRLEEAELVSTLETVLAVNGAALVGEPDAYRIVPAVEAPRHVISPSVGVLRAARAPGYSIRVVPLNFVAAGEMNKILEPLAPEGAILRVDEERNLIVLGGQRQDLDSLLETVDVFDVNWMAGMSFGLFPLKFAEAGPMAEELTQLIGQKSSTPGGKLLRFMPIERLNMILAISPQPKYLEQARTWVARLDQSDEAGRRLYVYYVQNGRASDVASVLNQVFSPEPPQDTAGPAEPTPTFTSLDFVGSTGTGNRRDRTGQLRGGRRGFVDEQRTGQQGAAGAAPAPGSTAAGRQPIAGEGRTGAAAEGGADTAITIMGEEQMRIIADETTNALVILATPADYEMLLSAIEKLDIVPLQVLVEATIAEVTLNDDLRYGVQWFLDTKAGEFTFSVLEDGAVSSIFPGFSYLLRVADSRIVVNALEEVTDVKVISSPSLMVLDNKTARLQVGDEVPIATQSRVSSTDADAPIVNSIQFVDTGVILSITPRVNAGGLVLMDIEQEVSDAVETTTSGIDSPTIQQRRVLSSVAVQSGETIALGGLIREFKSDTTFAVPILSKIPLIGALFRDVTDDLFRTELLVLITPKAVSSMREARAVTKELRSRIRSVEPLSRKIQ